MFLVLLVLFDFSFKSRCDDFLPTVFELEDFIIAEPLFGALFLSPALRDEELFELDLRFRKLVRSPNGFSSVIVEAINFSM